LSAARKAARIGDRTDHGGTVVGAGVPSVLIENQPAAVVGDQSKTMHKCGIPPQPPHPTGPFAGVNLVLIGGMPALRAGDVAPCGATVTGGAMFVEIGLGS
jgi:uncharacterized Zn-binding protein involved in type VI secretion